MENANGVKIGDRVTMGGYSFVVLKTFENCALIVSERILFEMPYNDVYKDITWADCSLRGYLNGEFLERFSEEERQRILLSEIENKDNPWFFTNGGKNTLDKVFLLSLDEACRYFGDSTELLYNKGKNQRYWFERRDCNNEKRLAKVLGREGCWWWWLRSPGRVQKKAVYIWGTDGGIGIQGNNVTKGNLSDGRCTGGVRPAMYIKLL